MKKSVFLLSFLCALTVSLHAELVWKPGNALITRSSQITATPPESSQFSVANLIRPESDGVGTNQYIYHTAWTGSNMIGPNEDPFLQFHLDEAKQHIIFSMIGSVWQATYDTPTAFSSGGHGFGFSSSFPFHKVMVTHLTGWLEGLDDILTGIDDVNGQCSSLNGQSIYNLAGQRVNELFKGIIIKGGKKILVR